MRAITVLNVLLLLLAPVRALAGQAQAAPEALYEASDGSQLRARFDNPAKSVLVTLPNGTRLALPLALSASGARYSNGRDTFWEHHGDARVEQDGVLVFQGREALLLKRERPVRLAAVAYLRALPRGDVSFAERFPPGPLPPDSFHCRLDAGQGGAPQDALCVHEIEHISADGALASVRCNAVPADAALRGATLASPDSLWVLLRREQSGNWRGVTWTVGQGQPVLGRKAARSLGLSAGALQAVGWGQAVP